MKVLVDTSVWIRALRGQTKYATALRVLLQRSAVAGHELVFGELLVGDRGGRTIFLEDYERMTKVTSVSHSEVVRFVRHHRLHGRGIGWTDAQVLAGALAFGAKLWTADEALNRLACEFEISFDPNTSLPVQ